MPQIKKIYILVPRLHNPGGVANYYSAIKPYLKNNTTYIFRGKDKVGNRFLRIIQDYYIFLKTIFQKGVSGTVVINHSLGAGSIFRDALYLILTSKKY